GGRRHRLRSRPRGARARPPRGDRDVAARDRADGRRRHLEAVTLRQRSLARGSRARTRGGGHGTSRRRARRVPLRRDLTSSVRRTVGSRGIPDRLAGTPHGVLTYPVWMAGPEEVWLPLVDEPVGPDDAARDRFREFARKQLAGD